MSRTIRKHRISKKPVRDGARQYSAGSCEHHGGCPVCEGNRRYTTKKRLAAADVARFGLDDE